MPLTLHPITHLIPERKSGRKAACPRNSGLRTRDFPVKPVFPVVSAFYHAPGKLRILPTRYLKMVGNENSTIEEWPVNAVDAPPRNQLDPQRKSGREAAEKLGAEHRVLSTYFFPRSISTTLS